MILEKDSESNQNVEGGYTRTQKKKNNLKCSKASYESFIKRQKIWGKLKVFQDVNGLRDR